MFLLNRRLRFYSIYMFFYNNKSSFTSCIHFLTSSCVFSCSYNSKLKISSTVVWHKFIGLPCYNFGKFFFLFLSVKRMLAKAKCLKLLFISYW